MRAALLGIKLNNKWQKIHEEIIAHLESKGITVDKSYFSTTVAQDAEDLEATYKRNQTLLKSADFIVAETTQYSGGIGYMIANALNLKKPVLALYNKDLGKAPSNIIKSSSLSKQLDFLEYSNKDLNVALDKFLADVKNKIDTKFILILSPEIDQYLEWSSEHKRMHKAQIVRDAVGDMMKEDKEWIQLNEVVH